MVIEFEPKLESAHNGEITQKEEKSYPNLTLPNPLFRFRSWQLQL
jgi:hypothetical protein